jgi:hypothetical protein
MERRATAGHCIFGGYSLADYLWNLRPYTMFPITGTTLMPLVSFEPLPRSCSAPSRAIAASRLLLPCVVSSSYHACISCSVRGDSIHFRFNVMGTSGFRGSP